MGGVAIRARIIPPTGTLPETIVARLGSSDTLHEAIAAKAAFALAKTAAASSCIRVTGVGQAKIVSICPETLEPNMASAIRQRSCKNCRGVLRLRFNAPARWAERRSQLEGLSCDQLLQRAQLCGLAHEATSNGTSPEGRRATLNLIIKAEGIHR